MERQRQLGTILMAIAGVQLLIFLIGVVRRSYLAIALPVMAAVGAVSAVLFWVGYAMMTMNPELSDLDMEEEVPADELTAHLTFALGSEAKLFASRIAGKRERWMRLVYPDGTIEFDFLARSLSNTTRRHLKPLDLDDPLGAAISAFVSAVEGGAAALVRPEEARRALESALLIEEAATLGAIPIRKTRAAGRVALSA